MLNVAEPTQEYMTREIERLQKEIAALTLEGDKIAGARLKRSIRKPTKAEKATLRGIAGEISLLTKRLREMHGSQLR